MIPGGLWGFSSQSDLQEWIAHSRRVIRRALIRGAYGIGSISRDDIDDVLQDLMCRFAAGCNGNPDYLERQYSIGAALAKYALADFWRKKARAGFVAVDPNLLEELDRSTFGKSRDEASAAYGVIELLLPHLTERQRAFLEYVVEHGFDINDVRGDRATVLEQFEMSDGAYRGMMKRISDVAGALNLPVSLGPNPLAWLLLEAGLVTAEHAKLIYRNQIQGKRLESLCAAASPIGCMCWVFHEEENDC